MEKWKDVKGFEGLYQVSDLGRIKSLPKLVRCGNGMRMVKGRFLKHGMDKDGYHLIVLSMNGKTKTFSVHRLVYENFVGEIQDGKDVNHIDECKDNNSLSNLNLMTHKENCNYASRNERIRKKEGKKVVMDNGKEFYSLREAAKYLGCSRGSVCDCCINSSHTVYGHHFRYK